MTPEELRRFSPKYSVDEATGCWIWIGASSREPGKTDRRRPYFRWKGRQGLAYAASYEHYVGPVPEGLELDHVVCNNGMCVNWAHLEAVTHKVNTQRRSARVTHCPQGHEYTPENTYMNPPPPGAPESWSPRRSCRTCKREDKARRDAAKRAARSLTTLKRPRQDSNPVRRV